MATTLVDPNGSQITVPDEVVHSYLSRGWVYPGTPTPAEPMLEDGEPSAGNSHEGIIADADGERGPDGILGVPGVQHE